MGKVRECLFVGARGVRSSVYGFDIPVLEVTYTIPGTQTTLQDLSYTYDAVGNIIQIIDASETDSAKTTDYTYDDLYRLISATITAPPSEGGDEGVVETLTYTYNILGNLTSRSDFGTYTYAGDTSTAPATRYANPHAVTSILKTDGTTINFSYDSNGNVKTDGTTTYTWDYMNRLTQTRKGTGPTSVVTSYAYGSGMNRMSKTSGSTTTVYPAPGYSVKGATSTTYISGASGLAASIENDPSTGSGSPSTTSTIHTDHLGSTSVVSDEHAVMIELLDYNPYGTERISWSSSASSAESQKTYIGEYSDDESGLSYLNARYYDPGRGQFLSQDSIFLAMGDNYKKDKRLVVALLDPQSQNSYSYARNNPVRFTDTSGDDWFSDTLDNVANGFDAAFNVVTGGAGDKIDDMVQNGVTPGKIAGVVAGVIGGTAVTAGAAFVAGATAGAAVLYAAPATPSGIAIGTSFGKLGNVVANQSGKITGFYREGALKPFHGLNQAISRYVSTKTILETVKNPLVTLEQAGGNIMYLTRQAAVILDKAGRVVTTYAKEQFQEHVLNVLENLPK